MSDRLNYHRLRYFWTVAREGSVQRASERLHVSQPTVSMQIQGLEKELGEKLFDRVGRRLVLTESGRMAAHYAEEIFRLGSEMEDALSDRLPRRTARLAVGIADVVPKLAVREWVAPAYERFPGLAVTFREARVESLLAELSEHQLDVVITDEPARARSGLRGFNHLLGESPVALFAAPALAKRLRHRFPASLEQEPLLVPAAGTQLRLAVDRWLEGRGLHPQIVGEFDDSALMKVFGQAGLGAFPMHRALRRGLEKEFGVRMVGELAGIVDRFYAVTAERRVSHPAVAAVTAAARETFRAGA